MIKKIFIISGCQILVATAAWSKPQELKFNNQNSILGVRQPAADYLNIKQSDMKYFNNLNSSPQDKNEIKNNLVKFLKNGQLINETEASQLLSINLNTKNNSNNEALVAGIYSKLSDGIQKSGFNIDPRVGILGLKLGNNKFLGAGSDIKFESENLIIDHFIYNDGKYVLSADRILIKKVDINNGNIRAFTAMNLKLNDDKNNLDFGWAEVSRSNLNETGIKSFKIKSSQLDIRQANGSTFKTERGSSGLETIQTQVDVKSGEALNLHMTSSVGFIFNNNAKNPQKNLSVSSKGGFDINAVIAPAEKQKENIYTFVNSEELIIDDSARSEKIKVSRGAQLTVLENKFGKESPSAEYAILSDEIQIYNTQSQMQMKAVGFDGKFQSANDGNFKADYSETQSTNSKYEYFNLDYKFSDGHIVKQERASAQKAIYITNTERIVITGNVNYKSEKNKLSQQSETYLSGNELVYTKNNNWIGTFTNFNSVTLNQKGVAEKTILTADTFKFKGKNANGFVSGGVKISQEEDKLKNTSIYTFLSMGETTGNFLADGSIKNLSANELGGSLAQQKNANDKVMLSQMVFDGKNFNMTDDAKRQLIKAQHLSFEGEKNKTNGDTLESFAVELQEAELREFKNDFNNYVITNSTVFYKSSKLNETKNADIQVKNLDAEIQGYKLTAKINNEKDPLNGKTIDMYYNKNKEFEYYSVKNENGIIAGEKNGKKVVWTGGEVQVYKDGHMKLANLTGTEFSITDDRYLSKLRLNEGRAYDGEGQKSATIKKGSAEAQDLNDPAQVKIDFSDVEILEEAGVQKINMGQFSSELAKVLDNKQTSIEVSGQNLAAAKTKENQKKKIVISQGRFTGNQIEKNKKIDGELSFAHLLNYVDQNSKMIEVEGLKFLIVKSDKNASLSGELSALKSYDDNAIQSVELTDLKDVKISHLKEDINVLLNGKKFAYYEDRSSHEKYFIVEQSHFQAINGTKKIDADVKVFNYFQNTKSDLKIIKEAQINGSAQFDSHEMDFSLSAKNIKFVNSKRERDGTVVRYYGIEPTASDSLIHLKLDHHPISIEIYAKDASVELISQKSKASYTFVSKSKQAKEWKVKLGPLTLNPKADANGDATLMINATAIGTQHHELLNNISGMVSSIPLNQNISYNMEGYLKAQAMITQSVGVKFSYAMEALDRNQMRYDNTANSMILTTFKKMKSGNTYGVDLGLLGASAVKVQMNSACGVRVFNKCLGHTLLIPMTVYAGVNRCQYGGKYTICSQLGVSSDLTSSAMENTSLDAEGRAQGRRAGGKNYLFGTSLVSDKEVVHSLAISSGELNGLLYKFYIPIK